jgi:hypothetical protein
MAAAVTANGTFPWRVPIAQAGQAVVAFWASGYSSAFGSRLVSGSGWESPTLVSANDVDRIAQDRDLAVAGSRSGAAMTLFIQGGVLYGNRYVPGSGWEGPRNVGAASNLVGTHAVSMDERGVAFAVFFQNGSNPGLYINQSDPATGWGVPVRLAPGVTGFSPGVTVDQDDNVTVVWSEPMPASPYDALWGVHRTGGVWTSATAISLPDQYTTQRRLTVDPRGNVTIVWAVIRSSTGGSGSTGFYDIWIDRYMTATGWGTPERIRSNAAFVWGGFGPNPRLAVDDQGHVTLIWDERPGPPNDGLWALRFE